MTKVCPKCGEEKDYSEFRKCSRTKTGIQSYCKACSVKYDAANFQKNKKRILEHHTSRRKELTAWLKEYKSGLKCELCGENHPATLDFHHRDPEEKTIEISLMIKGSCPSKKTILKEIEKCRVLCSNCHRKLHWDENNGN